MPLTRVKLVNESDYLVVATLQLSPGTGAHEMLELAAHAKGTAVVHPVHYQSRPRRPGDDEQAVDCRTVNAVKHADSTVEVRGPKPQKLTFADDLGGEAGDGVKEVVIEVSVSGDEARGSISASIVNKDKKVRQQERGLADRQPR